MPTLLSTALNNSVYRRLESSTLFGGEDEVRTRNSSLSRLRDCQLSRKLWYVAYRLLAGEVFTNIGPYPIARRPVAQQGYQGNCSDIPG